MFTGSAVTVRVIRTSAVKFSTLSLKSAAQFGALHSLALKFIEKAEAATAVAVAVAAEVATTAAVPSNSRSNSNRSRSSAAQQLQLQ